MLKRFDKFIQAGRDLQRRSQKISDGCTGVPDLDVRFCCEEHDAHYSDPCCPFTRLTVDTMFRNCIKKKHGSLLAWTYYLGVRAVGWRFWTSLVKPDVLAENRFDVEIFDEELSEPTKNSTFEIGATDE